MGLSANILRTMVPAIIFGTMVPDTRHWAHWPLGDIEAQALPTTLCQEFVSILFYFLTTAEAHGFTADKEADC